jgi:hypothetical protein
MAAGKIPLAGWCVLRDEPPFLEILSLVRDEGEYGEPHLKEENPCLPIPQHSDIAGSCLELPHRYRGDPRPHGKLPLNESDYSLAVGYPLTLLL